MSLYLWIKCLERALKERPQMCPPSCTAVMSHHGRQHGCQHHDGSTCLTCSHSPETCAVLCHHLKLLAEPFSPVSWQAASRTAPEASQVKQDAVALAAAEQMLAACGGAAVPTDEEQKQAIITCRRLLLELASIKVNLPCTPSKLSKCCRWLCNLRCRAVVHL